jgi:hypothetical protein
VRRRVVLRHAGVVEFLPGLRLAGSFYDDAVRPLLDHHFPGLPHAAALLGTGSEVLGFDSPRSTDHDWGPRLQLLLRTEDATHADDITAMLAKHLPATWHGYPTAFERSHEPERGARQRVEVAALGAWLTGWLGFDPANGITTADWLALPTQRIAEITGGAVYHDDFGALTAARTALAWYPDDVWRYVLACQWRRISQEEAFPGRCAEVGDELGSAIVTARIARDLMRLCLLMNRTYPPYSKWLGTAFARLPGDLPARLTSAVTAPDWPSREDHLVACYEAIAVRHNELGLTEPLTPTVRPFHDRPYRVLDSDRFVTALLATVPEFRHRRVIGAVDQFVDNTDALCDMEFTRAVQLA